MTSDMHSKKIDIGLIDPSPHRRLDLVPLNEARVAELALAYQRNRPVPMIIVREHPKPECAGRYQVIAGHHRLAAQRRNGAEKVWVEPVVADDDEVLTIAAEETRVQHDRRPGLSRDHAFEMVVSLYRWMMIRLLSEAFPQDGETSEGAKINGRVISDGIGSPQLIAELARRNGGTLANSGFGEKEIEAALSLLKSSTIYAPTVEWARDEIVAKFGVDSEPAKAASEMVAAARGEEVSVDARVVTLFAKPSQAAKFGREIAASGDAVAVSEQYELARKVVNAPAQGMHPSGEVINRKMVPQELKRAGVIANRTQAVLDERRRSLPPDEKAELRRQEVRARDNVRIVRARMRRTVADMSLFVDNVRTICDLTGLSAKQLGPAELAQDVAGFREEWKVFLSDVRELEATVEKMQEPHD